jgi:hypothetical protein
MTQGEIKIGDKVRCYVSSLGKFVPMHNGIVTEIKSGYYMVDRMSLHGGAPWICAETIVRREEQP